MHDVSSQFDYDKISCFVLDQLTQLEKERTEAELQLKRLKHELHMAQLELNKTANQHKEAQNQIQMLSKEKGI